MVILHDAIKTIHNAVLCFFQKKTKTCFFKKNKRIRTKKAGGLFFSKKRVFLNHDCLSTFLWFSLDRTIWNKSRNYQFLWVCAAHLEYRSQILKNVRITGIWMRKNSVDKFRKIKSMQHVLVDLK